MGRAKRNPSLSLKLLMGFASLYPSYKLIVIASEAKQSSFGELGRKAGLLRRFAPQ
jgi:hypothetical protein